MNIVFIIQPELKTIKNLPNARDAQDRLAEAGRLAEAINLEILHSEIINIARWHAGTGLGRGTIERLADLAATHHHPLILINTSLSAIQQRNLEQALKCKVIDRTALILEIFGARAASHAGRLQVELAALTFQKSRLVRSWTHLERQRGGGGFLGGPGERQLELDKRILASQIKQIKHQLANVTRTRNLQRRHRHKNRIPAIALVGYTNAGKSTLFNALTGADIYAKDQLFATLDPTVRALELPSGRSVVISDTVGFISDLPTELIEAFRSTLEEVCQADLILHIHDIADSRSTEQARDVIKTLDEIGIDNLQRTETIIHVFNKADQAPSDYDHPVTSHPLSKIPIICSALTGGGLDELNHAIDRFFAEKDEQITVSLRPEQTNMGAWLYQHGQIKSATYDEAGHQKIKATLSKANKARFIKNWPDCILL